MVSSHPSHIDPDLPPIDEHLVESETRYEMYDGELVYVPPAQPPHATRHAIVLVLVESHAAPEFRVACDLLTRVSWDSDVAPDVSVLPRAPDPKTGGRQLEHLAFEIVSTESLGHAGRKAAKLSARGVRRVFAIDISRGRVLEWSGVLQSWSSLDMTTSIEDPALAAALPLAPLIHAVNSDDLVARALLAKHNAVIAADRARAVANANARGKRAGQREGLAEGLAEGSARGRAEALLVLLAARGIATTAADRARIRRARDPARLDRWIGRAARGRTLAEVLAEP
jgi:Uma2 family endonuclease